MAVSAVLRLDYLLALCLSEPKEHANTHRRCLRIGETHCAPLLKYSKACYFWCYSSAFTATPYMAYG